MAQPSSWRRGATAAVTDCSAPLRTSPRRGQCKRQTSKYLLSKYLLRTKGRRQSEFLAERDEPGIVPVAQDERIEHQDRQRRIVRRPRLVQPFEHAIRLPAYRVEICNGEGLRRTVSRNVFL